MPVFVLWKLQTAIKDTSKRKKHAFCLVFDIIVCNLPTSFHFRRDMCPSYGFTSLRQILLQIEVVVLNTMVFGITRVSCFLYFVPFATLRSTLRASVMYHVFQIAFHFFAGFNMKKLQDVYKTGSKTLDLVVWFLIHHSQDVLRFL